jgi:ComF family protein
MVMRRNPSAHALALARSSEIGQCNAFVIIGGKMRATPLLVQLAGKLLPSLCASCGDSADARGWCVGCRADIPGREAPRCQVCALPGATTRPCGGCLSHPPAYARTVAACDYAFPLDAMVSQFKYGRNLALARPLGTLLCEAVGEAPQPDLLLPVPISRGRMRERGFNQAAEIARVVAHSLKLELELDAVTRRDADPPQASLPLGQRTRSVRGAFRCQAGLRAARVALVDDVMTSGATLNELAAVVRNAGALEVHCWVVARTPRPE